MQYSRSASLKQVHIVENKIEVNLQLSHSCQCQEVSKDIEAFRVPEAQPGSCSLHRPSQAGDWGFRTWVQRSESRRHGANPSGLRLEGQIGDYREARARSRRRVSVSRHEPALYGGRGGKFPGIFTAQSSQTKLRFTKVA
jgi:hypothetical protein